MAGGACVGVAYSGGRDSTALLHATLGAAEPLGIEVVALHVHHGLQPDADDWLVHCRARCERWARAGRPIRFDHRRLTATPPRGASLEAWARDERYRALAQMARHHGCALVLLAHHRRDQAETVLLQALRGAGPAGWSAMPAAAERAGVLWHRPWLQQPSAAIDAYVRRHRLRHVEDTSNSDPRHARNRLRLEVWPALIRAFPDAELALATSAAWAQDARACLDELAQADLAQAADARGLDLERWAGLSAPRRSNALRAWLARCLGHPAPASLVQRLMVELDGKGPASWPTGAMTLRRYRGRLRCVPGAVVAARDGLGLPVCIELALDRPGRHVVAGWPGWLQVDPVREGGAAPVWLAQAQARPRAGGERFQAGPGRPPRSLKKQYQAAGVAGWERDGPLVFSRGQLVYAPGLGLDARVLALPGQPQLRLTWVASDAAGAVQGDG